MPKPWQPWHTTAVFVYVNAMLLRLLLSMMFGWSDWTNILIMVAMMGVFIWWGARHP